MAHQVDLEQAFTNPKASIAKVFRGIVEFGLPYYVSYVIASKFQPGFGCVLVPFNSQYQRLLALKFIRFHVACQLYALQFGNPPTPGNFSSDQWKQLRFNDLYSNELTIVYDGTSVLLSQTYPMGCDNLDDNPWATYKFALNRDQ
jgi:hypothetical protein